MADVELLQAENERLRAELSRERTRVDWLERTARSGGIFLYLGRDVERERRTAVGLGLIPGRCDRTLREAIDQAIGASAAQFPAALAQEDRNG